MRPKFWLGALAAAVLLLAAEAAAAMTPDECAVWVREQGFAQSVEHHDAAAFAAFIHPEAVFNAAAESPLAGRDAIVAAWAGTVRGDDMVLRWRPQFVSIAGGGDVALSRGPYMMVTRDADGAQHFAVGAFTSVWTRARPGAPWLVTLDGAGSAPTPMPSEDAMRAYFAAAPSACQ